MNVSNICSKWPIPRTQQLAARFLSLFLFVFLLGISGWCLAESSGETPQAPPRAGKPPPSLTADQAAERARQQTGGRMISLRAQSDGYWVRMLTARGEVRELWIPASQP